MDTGFYTGILLWPLLKSLCDIHALYGLPETLSVAHLLLLLVSTPPAWPPLQGPTKEVAVAGCGGSRFHAIAIEACITARSLPRYLVPNDTISSSTRLGR